MQENNFINKLVIHCSATPIGMDIGVEEIRKWHQQKGWSDIGYHFVIRRNGKLEEGRDIKYVGAHAKGFNYGSIGICLVGGVNTDDEGKANFTFQQYNTLFDLINELKLSYNISEVLGHRDLPNVTKDCPCFDVKGFLENS